MKFIKFIYRMCVCLSLFGQIWDYDVRSMGSECELISHANTMRRDPARGLYNAARNKRVAVRYARATGVWDEIKFFLFVEWLVR